MDVRVERLPRPPSDADLGGLADVLVDCVDGGASIGFLSGFGRDEATAWWRRLVADDAVTTWRAVDGDGVTVGTVSLRGGQPDNGRHRADVTKLLVSRAARGRGVAAMLMGELEDEARARGLTLLMLDTHADSPAERLYRRLGWTAYGRVEDHAALPDGSLADTTFFVRRLAARSD